MPLEKKNVRAVVAEFLGTMLFVYVGVGSANQSVRGNGRSRFSRTTRYFSLLWTRYRSFCVHDSWTFRRALESRGNVRTDSHTRDQPSLGLTYIAAQCFGAYRRFFAAMGSQHFQGFAVNVVQQYDCTGSFLSETDAIKCRDLHCGGSMCNETNADRMWASGFVVEFFGTFMLMLTVLLTAVHKDSVAGNVAPLTIGFSVFFAHMTSIPITNCGINPARSIGAAIVASMFPWTGDDGNNDPRITSAWEQIWFFWLVPLFGSIVGAGLFRVVFLDVGHEDNEKAGFNLNPLEDEKTKGGDSDREANAATAAKSAAVAGVVEITSR